jgi:sulfite oxidase
MTPSDEHPELTVHQREPFNAGPPLRELPRAFVTPMKLFFVRNHGEVPAIDAAGYRLVVAGAERPLALSLADLRERFPAATVMATLECAGNRRSELAAIAPTPGEVPWGAEAIGNAVWTGVPLVKVLSAAGIPPEVRHVAFAGLDTIAKGDRTFGFGGSLPIEKALGAEVLLAYEMNGEPLTAAHGFPVRVVVPGYIGARSVKWLGEITLQAEPSSNYYQAHAYKLFPPEARPETADWTRGEMLGELSVNCVICRPTAGDRCARGPLVVEGYAVAGAGGRVARVEISADGGATWSRADMRSGSREWTWALWEARIELPPGDREIVARAVDSAGTTQPAHPGRIWNFKGYMNNAWHRVRVSIDGAR